MSTRQKIIGVTLVVIILLGITVGLVYADQNDKPGDVTPSEQPAPTQTTEPKDYNLINYKFDFQSTPNINASKVLYNGESILLMELPSADLEKAINSAISTEDEAKTVLNSLHDKLSEAVSAYKNGYLETTGAGHSVQAAEQQLDYILKDTLSMYPPIYDRLSEIIGHNNPKAAEDLADVSTLAEIATEKRDIQAVIFAHRIVHDLNSWVIGRERPLDVDERYGASRAMDDSNPTALSEIQEYITMNQ